MDTVDDGEKLVETASLIPARIERILWIACRLAKHNRWILYSSKTHQFSIAASFRRIVLIRAAFYITVRPGGVGFPIEISWDEQKQVFFGIDEMNQRLFVLITILCGHSC